MEDIKYSEDTFFIQKYIFYSSHKAAISRHSLYYYRKRKDNSSVIDNSLSKETVSSFLDNYLLYTINFYNENLGYIPACAQSYFIYNISWFINLFDSKKGWLTLNLDKLKEIFSYIDLDNFLKRRPNVLRANFWLGVVNLFL